MQPPTPAASGVPRLPPRSGIAPRMPPITALFGGVSGIGDVSGSRLQQANFGRRSGRRSGRPAPAPRCTTPYCTPCTPVASSRAAAAPRCSWPSLCLKKRILCCGLPIFLHAHWGKRHISPSTARPPGATLAHAPDAARPYAPRLRPCRCSCPATSSPP